MKKLIIAAAALMVSIAAYGQGQFVLNNRITAEGINARFVSVTDASGSSSIGSPDWTVSLLGGPKGTPVGSLVALDPSSTTMRGAAGTATAGYLSQVTPTVPNVAPGASADIVLRLKGPGGYTQDFGPFNVAALGGGTVTPPNLPMGGSPLVVNNVPEPATLALSALGLGALLAIRRRK